MCKNSHSFSLVGSASKPKAVSDSKADTCNYQATLTLMFLESLPSHSFYSHFTCYPSAISNALSFPERTLCVGVLAVISYYFCKASAQKSHLLRRPPPNPNESIFLFYPNLNVLFIIVFLIFQYLLSFMVYLCLKSKQVEGRKLVLFALYIQ